MMGVYAIINAVTGRAYVGASTDVASRLRSHWSLLNRGSHNRGLQRDWTRWGESAFHFRLLEAIDDPRLLGAAETHWQNEFRRRVGVYNRNGGDGDTHRRWAKLSEYDNKCDRKHIGRRLQELREAKRLSQQDLATQLDVSVATVSRWERGLTEPYRRSLRDMARIFDVKPEEIELVLQSDRS